MCRAATIARCCWNCKAAKRPRNIRCVEKTVPFFCRACGYKTCSGRCFASSRMPDLAIYSITSFSARQRAHIVRPYRWHTITIPSASLKTHLPLHIKMVPHPIRGHGTISFYPTLCDVSSCSVLFVPAHQYTKHYRQHKIDHCHHHKAAKQTAHISNQQVFQGRRVNAQAR